MPAQVSVPYYLGSRVITFDETAVSASNQRILYDEVTDLCIHAMDYYSRVGYSRSVWKITIESENATISARITGKAGTTPEYESYQMLWKLCFDHIVPNIGNRVVALLRNPTAEVPYGPITLTPEGIRYWSLWSGKRMLPWAEYGGTTSEQGRLKIWQQGPERKKVWSSHKISENMVCTFSVVLNR